MKIKDKISIIVILGLILFFLFLIFQDRKQISNIAKYSSENRIPYKSKVIVANGCGTSGIASKFRDILLKNGFVVYSPQNEKYWTYDESVVLSLDGNMDIAREVAKSLNIKHCFMYKKENSYEAVKVIIGKDYKEILKKNKQNWKDY